MGRVVGGSYSRLEEDADDARVLGGLAERVADGREGHGRRGERRRAALRHGLGEGAGELDDEDGALRGGGGASLELARRACALGTRSARRRGARQGAVSALAALTHVLDVRPRGLAGEVHVAQEELERRGRLRRRARAVGGR